MDAKKIALLVGALIVAGITAFMAKTMFAAPAVSTVQSAIMPAQPDGPEILVATRTLPVGTIIEPDSFRFQPWPEELIENAYYIKGEMDGSTPAASVVPEVPAAGGSDSPPAPAGEPTGTAPSSEKAVSQAPSGPMDPSMLAGMVVRVAISAGQPLTKGSLVQPGDRGFLAAALGPGMRAISVQVDARTGVSGFIFPGDRVDVVLSQSVSTPGSEGSALLAAETIVRNVRVLATDQRTVSEDAEGKREVKTSATITLEVTPRLAEKVAVAQSIGQITLALRSIADNTAELERAIASGEVKVPDGKDPNAEKRMLLQVASRPIDTDPTFVVGADVSRFQRRTVPVAKAQITSSYQPRSSNPYSPEAAQQGPVVRVARGNNVTVVPVGSK